MNRQALRVIPVAIVTSLGTCALAQPGGGGGAGGRGQFDPAQFIERMMENDANGDGKLSRDELPGRFADRLFESGDTNGDGFIDKAELEASMENMRQRQGQGFGRPGAEGGPGAPGGPGGEAGEPRVVSFHDHMSQAGRAMRQMRRSEFNAASRENDLELIQTVQTAIIGAKGQIDTVTMAEAAKAKYGNDTRAYNRDFRKAMVDAMIEALNIEAAVLEGNSTAAKESLNYLLDLQQKAHDIFQPEEEEERPAGAAPRNRLRPEGAPERTGRPGGRPGNGG